MDEADRILPVYEPGAYLMLGDGHAGHGDRELLAKAPRPPRMWSHGGLMKKLNWLATRGAPGPIVTPRLGARWNGTGFQKCDSEMVA